MHKTLFVIIHAMTNYNHGFCFIFGVESQISQFFAIARSEFFHLSPSMLNANLFIMIGIFHSHSMIIVLSRLNVQP